jgi:hypothetical protein
MEREKLTVGRERAEKTHLEPASRLIEDHEEVTRLAAAILVDTDERNLLPRGTVEIAFQSE